MDFDAKSGFIVLRLKNGAETEEIYFSPKDAIPSGMKYRGKDKTEYTLIGSGLKELEKGIIIPLVINYRSSADGSDVTIKFRDIIHNTAMDAGEALECPSGLKETVLPCED
ncbi:MAG: hypothetical protein FJ088_07895 [Deltaproteobacteria bacterium]|nr:hypothetical protein [Deltaproteobacteria bacterium]